MADERKAGALLLSNLGMFNEARLLFENVMEAAILKAFDHAVEAFSNEVDWDGVFNLADDVGCWVAPATWNISQPGEDADHKAYFEVDCINDNDDYWTALLCKQGSEGGEAGFMFNIEPRQFGGLRNWNSYIKNIDSDIVDKLGKAGFIDQGKGKFFLPVHIDVIAVKEAWEEYGDENTEDFAEYCLEPLRSALKTIQNNLGIFDEIMNGYLSNSK